MESNKNSCVEEEIPEQPNESAAHQSAKHDVRRRRSCETEEQTVARRATDRSRAKRRRSAETSQQTEVRRAAHRSPLQHRLQLQKSAVSDLFEAALTDVDHWWTFHAPPLISV